MNDELNVVGIGNALVDVLVETEAAVIASCGLAKGTMALMEIEDADRIQEQVGAGIQRSGGSAANTMAGLASLGSPAGFIGKVASDGLGQLFGDDIRALGVEFGSPASTHSGDGPLVGTGRSLILITPDADRTMCTSLGVAAALDTEDIDGDLVARAKMIYLEGYLFDRPAAKDAFRYAIKVAHDRGRKVAMSLSDPFCVERHRRDFLELVDGPLDVLFGNADEIRALAQVEDLRAALARVRRPGLTVTVTLGAQGALAFEGDQDPVEVPALMTSVVDTTGAGDLYAAGFLHGLTTGLALEQCAALGSAAAAECISHVGARPEVDLAALVPR